MLVLIVGLGAGSLIYTWYRLKDNQEFFSDDDPMIDRIEKAKGETITLTETKDGNRKWVLKMKTIRYSKNNSVGDLDDVKGMVYGDNQKVLFMFEAPKGKYYKDDNRIVLTNGARMLSPSTKVLIEAKHMDWSADQKNVVASGGVEMKKKDFGMTRARKAEFAMDFSHIRFTGNATTVIGGHPNTGD